MDKRANDAHQIVIYHNDLNKIQLPSFTEQEQNLLFGILSRLRNAGSDEIIKFSTNDLRNILNSDYSDESLFMFALSLDNKFFKANFRIIAEKKINDRNIFSMQIINLFNTMEIVADRELEPNDEHKLKSCKLIGLEIKVNPDFAYILNDLRANFTRFELAEFVSLSGKYTKTLYRLLKQYRSRGQMDMEWDEFMRVMDIPADYNQSNIDQWILKPAIKELTRERMLFDMDRIPFQNLTYRKIKGNGRGRGGNVVGIEFKFKPENITPKIQQITAPLEYAQYEKKHFWHKTADNLFYCIKKITPKENDKLEIIIYNADNKKDRQLTIHKNDFKRVIIDNLYC